MWQVLVIMLARVLAVEMLCCVMVGGFVLPPLRRRLQLIRDATVRAAPRCCACLGCLLGGRRWRDAADDAGLAQQAWLQRKAKLQEHLSKVMQERQLEHAHRLAALQLRLSLLRTYACARRTRPPHPHARAPAPHAALESCGLRPSTLSSLSAPPVLLVCLRVTIRL